MRIRPIFWYVLAASCLSVLLLATLVHLNVPVMLQITLDHSVPRATHTTTLTLHLTDPQGLPVDDARAVSNVNMTNMDMGNEQVSMQPVGGGSYVVRLQWSMSGPWRVTVQVHADGFTPAARTVFVHVT